MRSAREWTQSAPSENESKLQWRLWIEQLQADAWKAGAEKMAEEIINDGWGSWAEAGVKSVEVPPLPIPPEDRTEVPHA